VRSKRTWETAVLRARMTREAGLAVMSPDMSWADRIMASVMAVRRKEDQKGYL
jgi:hypothetical protein